MSDFSDEPESKPRPSFFQLYLIITVLIVIAFTVFIFTNLELSPNPIIEFDTVGLDSISFEVLR